LIVSVWKLIALDMEIVKSVRIIIKDVGQKQAVKSEQALLTNSKQV